MIYIKYIVRSIITAMPKMSFKSFHKYIDVFKNFRTNPYKPDNMTWEEYNQVLERKLDDEDPIRTRIINIDLY